MTVILPHGSSHSALWHLAGMPKASFWAVCWAPTTGKRGLRTIATWKPQNTVAETVGIWGNSGTAVTETHRKWLMGGYYVPPPWWGLPLASGKLCTGCRDAGFALMLEDRHTTLIKTHHTHFLQ